MKLKNIVLFAATSMLALTSCNDYLDVVPDTRVKLETVEQCRKLMVNAYMDINYAATCELSSDNIADNNAPAPRSGVRYNRPYYDQTDEELFKFEDVKMGIGNDSPSGVWSGCYGAIAACNAVLEAAQQLEEKGELTAAEKEQLQAIKGEAYLSRAFHHFILVNVFCMPYGELFANEPGIPYATEPETTVRPHYDRSTVKETWDKIEADLLKGLELEDDAIYKIPKYHFNRQAANAFAARFYLFERKYEKVDSFATAAFANQNPADLMQDGWTKKSQFYSSSDISRYWSSTERPGVFLCISTYSTWGRRFGYRFSCNRDARRCTIQGPGLSWKGIRWTRRNVEDEENRSFAMHPCFQGFCYYRGDSEWGEFFVGNAGEQFEYTDKIQGIGYAHMVRAEFTADETVLCRAEARAFMGDYEGAIADIKIWDDAHKKGIETQYNFLEVNEALLNSTYQEDRQLDVKLFGIVKPIKIDSICPVPNYALNARNTPYIQCIQHLRRIQNVHNGMRWFDIKRLGLPVNHVYGRFAYNYDLVPGDRRYAIQIPTEVISAGMEPTNRQNPKTNAPEAAQESKGFVLAN